ncbi:uncharacterized protein LOC107001202 [Solanum pennellii]|uniref:Uncharacterized protein LOC107001202 n=1 Tax=Solanum pennellii TaxID=28526 RepID=A0ABM1FCD1_SOLPN|nr:uncharacterized protein LOC107001202 [Solanum pennellii]
MLIQAVTNLVGQPRGARQEGANTLRIQELLRMNSSSFTGSSTTEDLKKFVEELKKKEVRIDDAPYPGWACFEEAFFGRFFPHNLKEEKVREFLTLKQDSLNVHEYAFKFTQLSRYAIEMVKDIRSRMSLFVVSLDRAPSKEDLNLHILRVVVRTGGSKPLTCTKYCRNHSGIFRERSKDFFKCVQIGHFIRECPKSEKSDGNGGNRAMSSSAAPPERAVPRGATSGADAGTNHLYALNNRQEQENSPNVATVMIGVFNFDVYAC